LGAHNYVQRGRWREGREGGKEGGRAYEKECVCEMKREIHTRQWRYSRVTGRKKRTIRRKKEEE